MVDYYYAEFFLDPDEARFADVVEGTVDALLGTGCRFRTIALPREEDRDSAPWGWSAAGGLERLREICEEITSEGLIEKRRLISFPPSGGHIVFSFDFDFDAGRSEEIRQAEEASGSPCTDLSLSFSFSPQQTTGRHTMMTLKFWEDFVLRGGYEAIHAENMRKVINILKLITKNISPYFGVMNSEKQTDPDRSFDLLKRGLLPEGNEYVYVGHTLTGLLNVDNLTDSGRRVVVLPDASVIIEFTDRWGGLSPLED